VSARRAFMSDPAPHLLTRTTAVLAVGFFLTTVSVLVQAYYSHTSSIIGAQPASQSRRRDRNGPISAANQRRI